jgi:hypothetical protein
MIAVHPLASHYTNYAILAPVLNTSVLEIMWEFNLSF